MNKILLVTALMLSFIGAFAQSGSHFEKLDHADTIQIALIQKRHAKKSFCKTVVEAELRYDFQNQYPYYQLPFPVLVGDSLEFSLEHFPGEGYLYVYSLSPQNVPVLHQSVALRADGLQAKVPAFMFQVGSPGTHHLCFLYSRKPIQQPERFVGAMEMTMGTFLFRQYAMLGSMLITPQRNWYLLDEEIGLAFDPKVFSSSQSAILVYVEVPAQAKATR